MWGFVQYQDNIALLDENGIQLTYCQLESEGERIAKAVGKRCVVFSLCENTIGSVLGYTAFVNNHIVPVLLNSHLDEELLDILLEKYSPSYLWVPEKSASTFNGMKKVYSAHSYCLLETGYGKEYEINPELCLMLTTSGSTGSPKFVRQSYKNVEANAKSIVEYLKLDETEKPITTLPMNYTYGLSIINSHLLVGATILLTNSGLMQKEFWSFFKEAGATSLAGVPYTYEMLDRLRFGRMQLPSLRYLTQAGGKLTSELHKKFAEDAQKRGTKFIVMYGQCEATARMGYLPAERSIDKCGSMGVAISGGTFHLVDEDGNEVKTCHTTGELVYEGPNVTLGYAECGEDLIKDDERNGILATGDMAQFDEDGFFYIVGRKKRFLKIYGNRVNLDEIERLIKGEFGAVDCASAGIDDNLYIFVTDESLVSSIKEYISEKTQLNKTAFNIIVLDEIPKNDSGKTLYNELTKFYQ